MPALFASGVASRVKEMGTFVGPAPSLAGVSWVGGLPASPDLPGGSGPAMWKRRLPSIRTKVSRGLGCPRCSPGLRRPSPSLSRAAKNLRLGSSGMVTIASRGHPPCSEGSYQTKCGGSFRPGLPVSFSWFPLKP